MSQELNKAPPSNCRQQLAADGKPYPRSSCAVCGQFSPRWKECDALLAAGPLPPAGNDPELRKVVTEALVGMIAAVTCTTPPADGPLPGFIQAPVDRAVTRITEYLNRLRAENAALQQRSDIADQRADELARKTKLYDQLQRGAELLPEGWMITVEIERDGGGVTLIDPQGNDLDYPSNRESMGDEVEDAIEEALAQQAAQ